MNFQKIFSFSYDGLVCSSKQKNKRITFLYELLQMHRFSVLKKKTHTQNAGKLKLSCI